MELSVKEFLLIQIAVLRDLVGRGAELAEYAQSREVPPQELVDERDCLLGAKDKLEAFYQYFYCGGMNEKQ